MRLGRVREVDALDLSRIGPENPILRRATDTSGPQQYDYFYKLFTVNCVPLVFPIAGETIHYMKKALTIFLLNSVLVLAQGRGGTPPTPAEAATRRVTFLTNQLSLTASQQQQATAIFTAAATAATALRESSRTAREALNDAVKANDIAAIDRAAATIGNLTVQQTSNDAKAEAAFYQILTPDQKTKFSESRGPGRPGGFGPEGFGPRGGPGRFQQ